MKAARFIEPYKFDVVEVEKPKPEGAEVLLKVDYCAICGSDLHTYKLGLYVESGQIMGHEFGAVVEELGPDYVGDLKVGDRVVTNPTVACRHCVMCMDNKPNICENALTATIAYGRDGAFAQYVLQGAGAYYYKLPDNVSTREGALIEPLSVAVHAVNRAKPKVNDKAVVFGAGTLGVMTTQVLKAIGCTRVIQVDMSEPRLEVAKKAGADYVINPAKVDDVIAEIAKIYGPGYYGPNGAEADLVFECAGVNATVRQAIQVVRHGGKIVCIANTEEDTPINVTAIVQKEVDFIGSYAYVSEFQEAIDLVASGKVNLDLLISEEFPIDQIGDAFECACDTLKSVKVVVNCD